MDSKIVEYEMLGIPPNKRAVFDAYIESMLEGFTEEKRALLESIKKAATDTIRPGFLSPSEQKEAIAAQAYAMASMIDSLLASLSEREG